MAKFKIKNTDNSTTVTVTLENKERLNNSELDLFNRKYVSGFFQVVKKGKKVIYHGPKCMSLDSKLKGSITRHEFYLILEQIINIQQLAYENGISLNKINLDKKYVFINDHTKELYFIYLPLDISRAEGNFVGFIDDVVNSVIPLDGKDRNIIAQFENYIKMMKSDYMKNIEKFILKNDRNAVVSIKGNSGGISNRDGFLTDKKEEYYRHYGMDDNFNKSSNKHSNYFNNDYYEEAESGLYETESTGLMEDETDYPDDQTGFLEYSSDLDDDKPTGFLDERDDDSNKYPKLQRIATGENILIDKPVFRLGKEKSYADYFVSNNSAVSRNHADIVSRGNRYFVIDLNSKNRTFINEHVIPVRQETEIFNGDRLKLANEEFVFYTN